MKNVYLLIIMLIMGACASSNEVQKPVPIASTIEQGQTRAPASTDLKRLYEKDERQGCCSHHGGVLSCSGTTLYCNDGTASGCGC